MKFRRKQGIAPRERTDGARPVAPLKFEGGESARPTGSTLFQFLMRIDSLTAFADETHNPRPVFEKPHNTQLTIDLGAYSLRIRQPLRQGNRGRMPKVGEPTSAAYEDQDFDSRVDVRYLPEDVAGAVRQKLYENPLLQAINTRYFGIKRIGFDRSLPDDEQLDGSAVFTFNMPRGRPDLKSSDVRMNFTYVVGDKINDYPFSGLSSFSALAGLDTDPDHPPFLRKGHALPVIDRVMLDYQDWALGNSEEN